MASNYFDNNRDQELAFASLLNRLATDIISGHVRLIEADHERKVHTDYSFDVAVSFLTGRENLSIEFYRLPQENNHD